MFREMVFNLDFQHSITTGDISAAASPSQTRLSLDLSKHFESVGNKLYPKLSRCQETNWNCNWRMKITKNKQGQLNKPMYCQNSWSWWKAARVHKNLLTATSPLNLIPPRSFTPSFNQEMRIWIIYFNYFGVSLYSHRIHWTRIAYYSWRFQF